MARLTSHGAPDFTWRAWRLMARLTATGALAPAAGPLVGGLLLVRFDLGDREGDGVVRVLAGVAAGAAAAEQVPAAVEGHVQLADAGVLLLGGEFARGEPLAEPVLFGDHRGDLLENLVVLHVPDSND